MIEEEIRRNNARKTMKIANNICNEGKLKTGAFWEFKKQMDRSNKAETPSTMLDKHNVEKNTKEEIKEIFEDFYSDLFSPPQPSNELENLCHEVTLKVFEDIMEKAEKDKTPKEEITEEEIRKAVKSIKNKTSLDSENMSNRMIKHGGQDFRESVRILFNEINQKNEGPETWEDMIIKSIYKGKKNKKVMDNRRGLFLTNAISKLFDTTKMNRKRRRIENGISRFQTGGVTNRDPFDNQMTLNAIIDYNNLIQSETYVFFADAYKCFDKLDLKTCIIDLYNILGSQEAKLVYNLNKRSNIVIQTPVGDTKSINIGEIVKQGTVYGPMLCDINIDKVNQVGRKSTTTIGPNIECEASMFVDDIKQAGSQEHNIEVAASNCSVMETTRKVTFNNGVDKTAFMVINPKRGNEIQTLRNTIKKGKIGRTKEYKYVGEWYTEKYTHQKSISEKQKKVNIMINKIKYYGDPYKVGYLALQVRLTIYSSTAIPTLYTNVETWSTITKKEIEELEKIQKDILTSILELPKSTPYMGILAELGLWPIKQLIEYKRLTILHRILTSEEKRLLREIIIDQIERPYTGCWSKTTLEICEKYNIEVKDLIKQTKKQFKRQVKRKVQEQVDMQMKKEIEEKTKLRFCVCTSSKRKPYLEQLGYSEAKMILKLRLNMTELKCNYKNQYKDVKCDLCHTDNDTTEHLFQCPKMKEMTDVPNITTMTREDRQSNEQLARFIKNALNLKGIDINKTVSANFENSS